MRYCKLCKPSSFLGGDNMAEQIFSTRKPCIKCREKKGFTDINYSDFDVIKKGDYKFPQRIKAPAIPGGTNNYLCASTLIRIDPPLLI